jgi:threonine synthase
MTSEQSASDFVLGLKCPECASGSVNTDRTVDPLCPHHGLPQEAVFDLERMRSVIDRDRISAAPRGMWRWSCLMPLRDPASIVTLGEGDTRLFHARRLGEALGLRHLYLLDDTRNPTGSFKDRGASATISKCREVGARGLVLASSGNAVTSFSAYCARGDLPFYGLVLDSTSHVHRLQAMSYGARVFVVEGSVADAARLAGAIADSHGFFHCVQPYNLYRAEGKKSAVYEISEHFGWETPDRVMLPTAGGTNALAFDQAYRELNALGWVSGVPALDIVQPAGCAPIVTAWREDRPMEPLTSYQTDLVGLDHPAPKAGDQVVGVMRRTDALGWGVTDAQAFAAARLMARTEGVFAQPASAAGIAAFLELGVEETRRRFGDQRIVVIVTGTGKNQVDAPLAAIGSPPRIPPDLAAFEAALGTLGSR